MQAFKGCVLTKALIPAKRNPFRVGGWAKNSLQSQVLSEPSSLVRRCTSALRGEFPRKPSPDSPLRFSIAVLLGPRCLVKHLEFTKQILPAKPDCTRCCPPPVRPRGYGHKRERFDHFTVVKYDHACPHSASSILARDCSCQHFLRDPIPWGRDRQYRNILCEIQMARNPSDPAALRWSRNSIAR